MRAYGEAVQREGDTTSLRIEDIEILDLPSEAGLSRFHAPLDLEALAAEQGVHPIADISQLLGDFWPEDDDIDEFVAAIRAWRSEG